MTLLRIHGPFLFGTTEKLVEATANLDAFAPVVILRLRNMTAIDATGIHAIERFAERFMTVGPGTDSLRSDGAAFEAAEGHAISGSRRTRKHDAEYSGGAGQGACSACRNDGSYCELTKRSVPEAKDPPHPPKIAVSDRRS